VVSLYKTKTINAYGGLEKIQCSPEEPHSKSIKIALTQVGLPQLWLPNNVNTSKSITLLVHYRSPLQFQTRLLKMRTVSCHELLNLPVVSLSLPMVLDCIIPPCFLVQ